MKKYKFLLIDDEEIIRNGISENIDWEKEGFLFLEPAKDGLSAISSIEQYHPDVVLTDICMPGKDGIQISEYLFENYPETIVIILSGYDDFEYARNALRYNVFDYILKPISGRTLRQFLEKIREELEKRRSYKLNYSRLVEQANKNRECILSRFLYRLIIGKASEELLHEYKSYLPFNDSVSHYCVITLIPHRSGSLPQKEFSLDMCLIALSEAAERLVPAETSTVNFQIPEGNLVIILGCGNERLCRMNASAMAEALHEAAIPIPCYTVTIGVGTVKPELLDIGTSYNESMAALEYRLIAGDEEVFLFNEKKEDVPGHNIRFEKFPDRITESLRSRSLEDSVELIREFCVFLKNKRMSLQRVRFELSKFVYAVADVFDEIEVIDDIDELTGIIELPELPEIETALISAVTGVSERLNIQRRSFPEKKLFEIQKYLESEFYNPNITAEELARQFYISQSYLSRLFRHYSGRTFTEYLTGLRISRACELLKTTDKKNMEIAEDVGFKDAGYFSIIFKKTVGVSPSRYRQEL